MSARARLSGGGVVVALLLLGLLATIASPGSCMAAGGGTGGRRGRRGRGCPFPGPGGGGGAPRPAHIGASDAAPADIPPGYLARYVTAAGTCPALSCRSWRPSARSSPTTAAPRPPACATASTAPARCAGPMQFNPTNGPPSTWDTWGPASAPTSTTRPTPCRPPPASSAATAWPAWRRWAATLPAGPRLGRPPHRPAALQQRLLVRARGRDPGRPLHLAAPAQAPSRDLLQSALLVASPSITTTASHGCDPRTDLASAAFDLRVQSLLAVLAERHTIRS